MSFTPNLSIAILSIPSPNAKPEYFLDQFYNFSNTIGFTIPQPRISTIYFHIDLISTSADGSVNGKYDGLNLNSTSFAKNA